jgi:small-conductance mechanosensitive channel
MIFDFLRFFPILEPLNVQIQEVSFWGNSLYAYANTAILFGVLLAVGKLLQYFLLRRAEKLSLRTRTNVDDTFVEIVKSLKPPFYFFLAFYLAVNSLTLAPLAERIVSVTLIVWVTYQVIVAVQILISFILKKRMRSEEDPGAKAAATFLGQIIGGILWIVGILLVLSNVGVNITSLVAGLGIGGIAVAFALQSVLADLFSSFSIYFDKPFRVGDFITVGTTSGTVEKIGIKTTRLRALQGEQVIMSNKELTTSMVQNFKRMTERRIVFSLGVLYETPTEKIKAIPGIITEIIERAPSTRLDRVHFKSFGDFALQFEVVYFVLSAEYKDYLDIHQEINLKIKEAFEREGIGFAYPTQTVVLQKNK